MKYVISNLGNMLVVEVENDKGMITGYPVIPRDLAGRSSLGRVSTQK